MNYLFGNCLIVDFFFDSLDTYIISSGSRNVFYLFNRNVFSFVYSFVFDRLNRVVVNISLVSGLWNILSLVLYCVIICYFFLNRDIFNFCLRNLFYIAFFIRNIFEVTFTTNRIFSE